MAALRRMYCETYSDAWDVDEDTAGLVFEVPEILGALATMRLELVDPGGQLLE